MKHRAEKSEVRAARFTSIRLSSEPTLGGGARFHATGLSTEPRAAPNVGVASVSVSCQHFVNIQSGQVRI